MTRDLVVVILKDRTVKRVKPYRVPLTIRNFKILLFTQSDIVSLVFLGVSYPVGFDLVELDSKVPLKVYLFIFTFKGVRS